MQTLLQNIGGFLVTYSQPWTIIIFILAGTGHSLKGKLLYALMNFTLGWFNFLCFYGNKVFK